jgi:hypothetical protein
MPTPEVYVEMTTPQVVHGSKRNLGPQEIAVPERMPTPRVMPPFQRQPTPVAMAPLQREPSPQFESDSWLDPHGWVKAEDDLLRSLVHMSDFGDDYCDPPLTWGEIAAKMKEYVEHHGPLGPHNRFYNRYSVLNRWTRISPANPNREQYLAKV